MSLDEWKSLSSYADAHKRNGKSKLKKTRIHFYTEPPEDRLEREKFQKDYVQYMEAQTKPGVELFFLRAELASEMKIYNGFLIIDDEVVFTSEETQKREEAGRVDFNSKTVDDFILKFRMLLPQERHNTLTKEQFRPGF